MDRKYGPFVFLSPHMIFGNNVLHSGSQQKKVACFFALSLVALSSTLRPGLP